MICFETWLAYGYEILEIAREERNIFRMELPRESRDQNGEYGNLKYSLDWYEKRNQIPNPKINFKTRKKKLPPPPPELSEEEKWAMLEEQAKSTYYGETKMGVKSILVGRPAPEIQVNITSESKRAFFERLPKVLAASHIEKTIITPILPSRRDKKVDFGDNFEITTEQLDRKKKRSLLDTDDVKPKSKEENAIDPFTKFMTEEELAIFNNMRYKTYSTTSMRKLRKRLEENSLR